MKASYYWGCLMLCILQLFPCANTRATDDGAAGVASANARLPSGVTIYASESVDNGQKCLVGAKSDQDGLNERPVVYFAKADGGFAWRAQLSISKDMYQGRATHCLGSANVMYVLVQIDSDSRQAVNQTTLKVFELSRVTGKVITKADVGVPNVTAAYTSWVKEGHDHFRFEGNKLVIHGSYELLSDRDDPSGKPPSDFTAELPEGLTQ